MNLSHRFVTIGAALSLAAALVVIPAQAQGRGPGGGPGARGRGPVPGLAALGGLQRLNLTDAQRDQIKELVKTHRQDDQAGAKLADLNRQLRAAILADTPDLAQIEHLKSDIAAAQSAALAARIDLEMEVAQVLTPEQRAQARDFRPARRGARPAPAPAK
jgi:Spy/CpxP family protein refolding chaperone